MSLLFKRLSNIFFDLVESVVVAASIFVVIYLFIAQPHMVKGASMEPTFHDGEYILTDKISYKFGVPKRGDVIVFKAPRNPEFDYIKRIEAIPGDTISILNGQVLINNQVIKEDYINTSTYLIPGQFLKEGQELKLNPDEFFVMGDNRDHSSDSRAWGVVPRNDIIGKVFFRYWPPNHFGPIKNPITT